MSRCRRRRRASKKQTPFSVWYARRICVIRKHRAASKKQTPFSVWYPLPITDIIDLRIGLKEADAFQRLVFALITDNPQYGLASKKQTPFSVWYPKARRNRNGS